MTVVKKTRRTPRAPRAPRTLVRWNDESDQKLLLAMQSGCNAAGVALPWNKIAEHLGIGATEGAIVQHLSKLRSNMMRAGLGVPPPLRRGNVRVSGPKHGKNVKLYERIKARRSSTSSNNEDNGDDDLNANPDNEYVHAKSASKGSKKKAATIATKDEQSSVDPDETEDEEAMPKTYVAAGSKFLQYNEPEKGGTPSTEAADTKVCQAAEETESSVEYASDSETGTNVAMANGMAMNLNGAGAAELLPIHPPYQMLQDQNSNMAALYGTGNIGLQGALHPQDVVFEGNGQYSNGGNVQLPTNNPASGPYLHDSAVPGGMLGGFEPMEDSFSQMWQDGNYDQPTFFDDEFASDGYGQQLGTGAYMPTFPMPPHGFY